MERPRLLFRRGHNLPVSEPLHFSSGLYEATRSAVFRGSPPGNGRCRHSGFVPWRAILIGISGSAYRSLRRASHFSSRHWWRSFILSAFAQGRWDTSLGRWWPALACGTWLWSPCPLREPTQRCGMVWERHLHTDWTGRWKFLHLSHASPHITASEWAYLEERFERPVLKVGWGD